MVLNHLADRLHAVVPIFGLTIDAVIVSSFGVDLKIANLIPEFKLAFTGVTHYLSPTQEKSTQFHLSEDISKQYFSIAIHIVCKNSKTSTILDMA